MEMPDRGEVFEDRTEAGRRLAGRLEHLRGQDPMVLALPRGGVVVGYEVALALGAPLDVVVARKLGAPGRPELGVGAVAPGGVRVVDEPAIHYLGISEANLDRVAEQETHEMERRERLYRGDLQPPQVEGRTVVLVDDGLATGVTARAAILSLRRRSPRYLVLAAPVCASETAAMLRPQVDEIVCVLMPRELWAVGLWYRDFTQTTDEQVIDLLARARQERRDEPGGKAI